jgi:hypothetical protein
MINGDVNDFLDGIDRQNSTLLYQGFCYTFQANDLPNGKLHFIGMRWRAHTDDHIGIIDEENPDGTLKDWSIFYQYDGIDVDDCVKHFLEAKIFDNNTKSFWEVQDNMEWLG